MARTPAKPPSGEHEAAAAEHARSIDERVDSALALADEHWDAAVAQAEAMPEGGLHSVWTQPLAHLSSELEKAAGLAGLDVPRPSKALAGETVLPAQARGAFRRGRQLRSALRAHRGKPD